MPRARGSYNKMPVNISTYIKYLHQEQGIGITEIRRKLNNYTKTTLYRHMKQSILDKTRSTKTLEDRES